MDVKEKVKEIIAQQLDKNADEISDTAHIQNDLQADSLTIIEISMAFEEEFNIEIPDDDLPKIATVQDAVDYVQAKVAAA